MVWRALLVGLGLVVVSEVAAAGPRVAADVGDIKVRDAKLDGVRLRAGLAKLLPRLAACAKVETWSTYMALLTLADGKVARLSSSRNPVMTRDPSSGRWGAAASEDLGRCIGNLLATAAFDAKVGSGSASLFLSVHPVLARPPALTIASVTSSELDERAAAKIVGRRHAALTACFVPQWWLSPVLTGTMTMTAPVDANGRIGEATTTDTQSKTLATCFARELQGLELAKPKTTPARVAIALELRPGA